MESNSPKAIWGFRNGKTRGSLLHHPTRERAAYGRTCSKKRVPALVFTQGKYRIAMTRTSQSDVQKTVIAIYKGPDLPLPRWKVKIVPIHSSFPWG